jgi:hypothetical protein
VVEWATVPILTRVLAPVGAIAMAGGLFVPYMAYDPGPSTENVQIVDFDDLSYIYVGLNVLVAALAAAVIPFVLRSYDLCGWLLITLGGLSFLSFLQYAINPVRGGEDSLFLRPGGIIGLIGALLVVAAGVVALRTWAPTRPVQTATPYRPQAPIPPPRGWYPDPAGSATERYWDGTNWSNETR